MFPIVLALKWKCGYHSLHIIETIYSNMLLSRQRGHMSIKLDRMQDLQMPMSGNLKLWSLCWNNFNLLLFWEPVCTYDL